jgi:hypothetical protein
MDVGCPGPLSERQIIVDMSERGRRHAYYCLPSHIL